MATYTLTTNLIENLLPSDAGIIGSLFNVFTNDQNNNRLALDSGRKLCTLYSEAADRISDTHIKNHLDSWLRYLSDMLTQNNVIVYTDVHINAQTNDPFLEVASAINGGQTIIVYSTKCRCPYTCTNINHNNTTIEIIDKDEAAKRINTSVTNNNTTNNNVTINVNNTVNNTVNNNVTNGDQSPITTGNDNNIKL